MEIVETLCRLLDELRPNDPVVPHRQLVTFVKDRPGHDRRYAMDAKKIERELNWHPLETFESASARPYAGILNMKSGCEM